MLALAPPGGRAGARRARRGRTHRAAVSRGWTAHPAQRPRRHPGGAGLADGRRHHLAARNTSLVLHPLPPGARRARPAHAPPPRRTGRGFAARRFCPGPVGTAVPREAASADQQVGDEEPQGDDQQDVDGVAGDPDEQAEQPEREHADQDRPGEADHDGPPWSGSGGRAERRVPSRIVHPAGRRPGARAGGLAASGPTRTAGAKTGADNRGSAGLFGTTTIACQAGNRGSRWL